MPLKPDDTVCFCFHVSLRKVETFCKVQKPQVASQISDCLSAGTGCGWCVPMLKRIHKQCCAENLPWWRKIEEPAASPTPSATTPAPAADAANSPPLADDIDAEAYKAGRANYLKQGKGKPPPGAEE
ncbi:MAG: (2Fe-2S)-binding protein [Phycisphaerae bacterium]